MPSKIDFLYQDFSNCKDWQESDWHEFAASAWNTDRNVVAWVNNAGGDVLTGAWKDRPLHEKLEYLLQVDVAATLFLSRAVGTQIRQMEQQSRETNSPVVVNIGWDQAQQGMDGVSGTLFSATKGAIMAMTRSLAQDFAPHVRFNCVAPGWIQTAWGESTSDFWDARAKRESLLNRWGTPADVASTIAFLCGPDARFINGQIIPVNGGFRFSQIQDSGGK